jgi:hypothetical protein
MSGPTATAKSYPREPEIADTLAGCRDIGLFQPRDGVPLGDARSSSSISLSTLIPATTTAGPLNVTRTRLGRPP